MKSVLSNPRLTGAIAQAITIVTILALIALGLLYAGLPPFGPINDLLNALGALLTGLLAARLWRPLREGTPRVAGWLVGANWLGVAAIAGNSVLVAAGRLDWMIGGGYTALGFGLIGLWLLGFCRSAGLAGGLPLRLHRLGTISAAGMIVGAPAAFAFFDPDLMAYPLMWGATAVAAAGWLLYPVWCWLLGRWLRF